MAAGAGTVFELGAAASALALGEKAGKTAHDTVNESAGEPFFANRTALRRQFQRAAPTFAAGDALHREVAARMVERLGYVKLTPARTLDLGCATGAAGAALRALYPKTAITSVDFALGMAQAAAQPGGWFARLRGAQRHAVCADLSALPLAHASHGLVFSNLALHWLDDPAAALREAHRVLELGGLLMFSMLGPDTLCELRDAWAEAEAGARDTGAATQGKPATHAATVADDLPASAVVHVAIPASPAARWHVKRFIDLHDIGDLLVKTGFATPVMDMEKIVLTYQNVEQLVADLRATGSLNAMQGRSRGLTGKHVWQRATAAYEKRRTDGRLPATFEIVYGHAWKAPARKTAGGDDVVRFVGRGEAAGARPSPRA